MGDDASGHDEAGGSSEPSDENADATDRTATGDADADSPDAHDSSDGVTDSTDGVTASTDAVTDSTDGVTDSTDAPPEQTDGPDARSVVVPSRVYKAVTVFSTLFAVVAVVGGFVVLDVATERASLSLSEVDPVLALVGIAMIVAGAVTYAFSTRFRAEGMGNAKGGTDESSNNG